MKTFEEKFTAWVDGQLSGQELADFERELAKHPEAETERIAAGKVGTLLRENLGGARLENADFFNHQIIERIEADERAIAKREAPRERVAWPLSRLAFGGAFFLLIALLLFRGLIPVGPHEIKSESQYLAEVLNTRTDPGISATAFHSKEDNVTVLWLEGLEYLPEPTPAQ